MSEQLNHLHLLVRADVQKPNTTPEAINAWLTELVAGVGMKVLIPAQSVLCNTDGNEGVTGIVCLETSHASIHIWHDGYVQFDLYSCKAFDVDAVLDRFSIFDPTRIDYTLVDRNSGSFIISTGSRLNTIDPGDMHGTLLAVQQVLASTRAPEV